MTIHKRTLIDLADITAIEYECSHCHARFAVPIARSDRRIGKCPNCAEEWMPGRAGAGDLSDEQLVSMFVDRLRQLRDRKLGAVVRLQVASDE